MQEKRVELDRKLMEFADACRAANLRVTHQRLEIFRELAKAVDHPTADSLHRRVRKRMPTLSLDTLYRTLASLEEANLISRISTSEGGARFEANHIPHDHFVCRQCGCIRDVTSGDRDQLACALPLPEGCQVESFRVELRGVCEDCRSTGAKSRR